VNSSPGTPPRSPASKPRPWPSICPGAAPRPKAGSAPSNPSSTASAPGTWTATTCDKFVLSGADLLYWRRKREQWRLLAESAPDDATAQYLHQYFEPTARAIDGLEKALAGLGLLDDALAVDLRKPQDYFHRVWNTAFRAADLAEAGNDGHRADGAINAEECA
jgi:hypothetical protein